MPFRWIAERSTCWRSSGIISPAEAASGKVTGLERAIPKNKGVGIRLAVASDGGRLRWPTRSRRTSASCCCRSIRKQRPIPEEIAKKEPEPAPPPPGRGEHGKKKSEPDHKADKSKGEKPQADRPEITPPAPSGKSGRPVHAEKQPAEKTHTEKPHAEKPHAEKAQGDKQPADKQPSAKERLAKASLAKHKAEAASKHDTAEKHEKLEKTDKHADEASGARKAETGGDQP